MPLPSATAITQPRAWGYDGRIDDLLVRLVPDGNQPLALVAPAPQAPRVSTETGPEEFVAESGLVFSRSDLSGGSGLDFAHRRGAAENDPTRFWDSQNLIVSAGNPGKPDYVTLDYGATVIYDPAKWWSGSPVVRMARMNALGLLRSTSRSTTDQVVIVGDPLGTPTFTYETIGTAFPAVATWKNFAQDKQYIYVGMDTIGVGTTYGLWRRPDTTGSGWTQLGTARVSDCWWVKDRLIGTNADAGTLFVLNTGTGAISSTLLTINPPDATLPWYEYARHQTFNSVQSVGPFIMACAWNGTIYAFTDNAGTLELTSQTEISPGETPLYLGYHPSGTVLLSTYEFVGQQGNDTNINLYSGTVSSTGQLENLQLLKVFENDPPDYNYGGAWISPFTTYRDSIWFSAKAWGPALPGLNASTYQYNVATAGLFTRQQMATGSSIWPAEVVFVDGLPISGYQSLLLHSAPSGETVSGHVIYPAVDFFTASEKEWIDITLEYDGCDIVSNYILVHLSDTLDALLDPHHSSWNQIGSWANNGSSTATVRRRSGDSVLLDQASRYLLIKVTLVSGDPNMLTQIPRLLRMSLRASVRSREVVIDLPVNVSDRIEAPRREPFLSPGWGRALADTLVAMHGQTVEIELYEPPLVAQGIVEAVAFDVRQFGRLGAATETAVVRFRGTVTSRVAIPAGMYAPAVVWPWSIPAPVVYPTAFDFGFSGGFD